MIAVRSFDSLSSYLENSPRSFAGLMDLYESNYIGIRRLVPAMPQSRVCKVSRIGGALTLYLEVIERFRYTTELSLTYRFCKATVTVAEPDLRIKVYHDARLAEVMSAHLRNWPIYRTNDEEGKTQLASRWHVNRFLYKWLNYCLYQGHRFDDGA
jgi:uncharacterized protein YqiB (DUF1249 family)